MTDARRVLTIGLDGATFAILQPLMDRGSLPNLARLQQAGSWGRLLSTIPPVTAPAWSSFMTGVNPARHGVFHFFERDASGYTYEETSGFVRGSQIRCPTLWDILSRASRRVGVVNVPLTYPPRPINGFMITGMLTPPSASSFTYPPELSQRLGGYRIDLDHVRTEEKFVQGDLAGEEELLRGVNQLLDQRSKHTLRLMEEYEWELFAVVFVGTDRLFHELWHYLDPSCPAYESAQGTSVRRAVEAYLGRLDEVIGRLRAAAGPEATTIVMSDHGFGPSPSKRVNLNDWLVDMGVLHVRSSWLEPELWANRLGLRRPAIKRLLKRCIPLHLLRGAAVNERGGCEIPADWSRTQAYAVQMYNHVCGIEINLRGRKRQGIVEPGAEYEQLRDLLLAALRDLRDPDTGVRMVRSAHRREEIFEGEYLDQLPDLIVELDPRYAGLAPLGNGSVVTPHDTRRQGDHRQEGILLAQGPHVVSGLVSPSPGIVDLAPTILYLLDVAVPQAMDGRVLAEILDPDYVAMHPISYDTSRVEVSPHASNAYSGEEVGEVMDRLRDLGYVE